MSANCISIAVNQRNIICWPNSVHIVFAHIISYSFGDDNRRFAAYRIQLGHFYRILRQLNFGVESLECGELPLLMIFSRANKLQSVESKISQVIRFCSWKCAICCACNASFNNKNSYLLRPKSYWICNVCVQTTRMYWHFAVPNRIRLIAGAVGILELCFPFSD